MGRKIPRQRTQPRHTVLRDPRGRAPPARRHQRLDRIQHVHTRRNRSPPASQAGPDTPVRKRQRPSRPAHGGSPDRAARPRAIFLGASESARCRRHAAPLYRCSPNRRQSRHPPAPRIRSILDACRIAYPGIMVVAGRRRSIAFFIALGIGLISVIVLLYIGWVLLRWHTGILLFLGSLLFLTIIVGVVLNTTFLVREIRRNEQHDAFINAVTHELKTPVASIRLYLETLQTRPVEEAKRQEFYRTMVADSDRLLATIEQVLRTGRIGSTSRHKLHLVPIDLNGVIEECLARTRTLHRLSPESLEYRPGPGVSIMGDLDEVRAAV